MSDCILVIFFFFSFLPSIPLSLLSCPLVVLWYRSLLLSWDYIRDRKPRRLTVVFFFKSWSLSGIYVYHSLIFIDSWKLSKCTLLSFLLWLSSLAQETQVSPSVGLGYYSCYLGCAGDLQGHNWTWVNCIHGMCLNSLSCFILLLYLFSAVCYLKKTSNYHLRRFILIFLREEFGLHCGAQRDLWWGSRDLM